MRGGQGQELGRSRVGAGERQKQGSSRVGAGQAQSRNKAAAGARGRLGQERQRGRSGSTPGLGQQHGRSRQEQFKSRTGALYLLPVSAPMQYFMGRSRVGAGKEQGRIRAGAG